MATPYLVENPIKNKILTVLALGKPMTAKKLFNRVVQSHDVSYQAVHRTLKTLVDDGVLIRVENQYDINPNWLASIKQFINKTGKKHEITSKSKNTYESYKIYYYPIHFTPFFLGTIKIKAVEKIAENIKSFEGGISFRFGENQYHWFTSGVCVQVSKQQKHYSDIITLLLERRKNHITIIEKKSPITREIALLAKNLEASHAEKTVAYVMSIYFVEKDNALAKRTLEILLTLIAYPGILGITDNPNEEITTSVLENAKNGLQNIDQFMAKEGIGVVFIGPSKQLYATWANVVYCCHEQEKGLVENKLIRMEVELQHVWYLLYHTKMKVHIKSEKNFRKQFDTCVDWWEKLNTINPVEDLQYFKIKDVLIKTSNIKKLFNDLYHRYKLQLL